jgi:hypothetical protein
VNPGSTLRAILFGVGAAIIVVLAYAAFAEILQFTLGLLVVAFVGGWLIGNGIAYGAWSGREHETRRAWQWFAIATSIVAWVAAVFLAFFISQALLPAASTPLNARITLDGFLAYFNGLDVTRVVHVVALALMAFMAWRGAR